MKNTSIASNVTQERISGYSHLVIKDRQIYLDGVVIKGVMKYRLEAEGHGRPTLMLEIVVDNKGNATPEVST